ncbi:serine/threonine-protein kinase STY17-like protein [Tanacetum coccineum]
MNSYTFMLPDVEEGEEVVSRMVNFLKRAMVFIRNRRQANRLTRTPINRDRVGTHDRLVAEFFSENPMYDAYKFQKTFRIARPLFNRIVNEVTTHAAYFRDNIDCTGKEGIFPLLKCTSTIRQLAYGIYADFLDEYLQMSERSSRLSLDHFCSSVMENFGPEYLRKPTGDHGPKLRRKTYGYGMLSLMLRSNNDINVLYQYPLFNDLKTGRAPEIPFVANGVTYPWGYYLVDGIYPELATLVKTIPEPADDDNKRILYKIKQESARKDVERAFGVLKKKWVILANPA